MKDKRLDEESIGQVKDRMSQGKFSEALQLVQTLEQREDLPPEDHVICLILKSQILREKVAISEAVEVAEEAVRISQALGNSLLLVDAIISKAEALRYTGALAGESEHYKSPENLELLKHGEDLLNNLTNIDAREIAQRAAVLQRDKGLVYRALGEIDRSLQCLQRSFTLHEELGNRDEMIQVLWTSAYTYAANEDRDHQLEIFWKIMELHEEMDNKEGKAQILLEIANAYQAKGELALALEQLQRSQAIAEILPKTAQLGWLFSNIGEFYLFQRFDWKSHFDIKQKALAIFEELGIKSGIGQCLARISQHYWLKDGELGIALEYAEKALAAFEEVGEKLLLSWPHNNIGWIYQEKGEYTTALEYFEKALEIAEEVGNKIEIIQSLWSITQIQQANGDDSAAMDNYKRCLELYEDLGPWNLGPLVLSWIYHQLILLELNNQAVDQAQAYLQQFSELKERAHNVWIDQRYLIAEAQLLKSSTRIKDKAKAQEIFQQIIDDESAHSALGIGKVPAMLNLCELILFELRASSDAVTDANPVFQEAKTLITNLSSLAKAMPSYSLLIDSLILQSKFALLEGDLSSAMEFLDQAGITAEEKELTGYAQRVAEEQQQLESQFDTWQKLIKSNAPFQTRLEQARMDDYLVKALKMAQTRQTF